MLETKLLARRKTYESRTVSEASAMASLMWLFTPGLTVAVQVKTVVSPSAPVLMVAPGSFGSLFR